MSYRFSESLVQDALAIVGQGMAQDYGIKVRWHDGRRVSADIHNRTVSIPRIASASPMATVNKDFHTALMLTRANVAHEFGHCGKTKISKTETPKGALFGILNALEDVRMERAVAQDFPGYQNIFNESNVWGNRDIANKMLDGKIGSGPLWEALTASIFQSQGIRPAWMLRPQAQKYFDVAYPEFVKVLNARDTADCLVIAKKIFELLKEEAKKQNKPEPQDDKDQEQQDGDGKGESKPKDGKGKNQKQQKPGKDSEPKESDESAGIDEDLSDDKPEDKDGEDESGDEKDGEKSDKGESDGDEKSGKSKDETDEEGEGKEDADADEGEGKDSDADEEDEAEGKSDKKDAEGKDEDEGEGKDDSDKEGDEGEDGESDEDGEEGKGKADKEEDADEDGETASDDAGESKKGSKGSDKLNNGADKDAEDEDEEGEGKKLTPEEEKEIEQKLNEDSEGQSLQERMNDAIEEVLGDVETTNGNLYTSRRDKDQHRTPPSGNQEKYEFSELFENMQQEVAAMTLALEQALRALTQCRKDAHRRRGRIDGNMLVEIAKNLSRDVFYVKRQGRELDTAVSMVIDQSASMSGIHKIRDLTILLGECMHRLGIPFEIVGTTTACVGGSAPALDGFTRTNPIVYDHYKTFNEQWPEVRARMTRMRIYNHNIDGEAVEFAASRLANRSEARKIVFSLCDGEPCGGHDNDEELAENIVRVSKAARKAGIEVYGVGIGERRPAKYYGKENFIYLDKEDEGLGTKFVRIFATILTQGEVRM